MLGGIIRVVSQLIEKLELIVACDEAVDACPDEAALVIIHIRVRVWIEEIKFPHQLQA